MRAIWATIKRWGAAIAGALLVLMGAGWLWRRQKSKLGKALDETALAEARRKMDTLRATREEISRQVTETDDAIVALDQEIRRHKREILILHEGGTEVSDEELNDVFKTLGY